LGGVEGISGFFLTLLPFFLSPSSMPQFPLIGRGANFSSQSFGMIGINISSFEQSKKKRKKEKEKQNKELFICEVQCAKL
jgi:hypothetical protein